MQKNGKKQGCRYCIEEPIRAAVFEYEAIFGALVV